jgi:hypothetical protein
MYVCMYMYMFNAKENSSLEFELYHIPPLIPIDNIYETCFEKLYLGK